MFENHQHFPYSHKLPNQAVRVVEEFELKNYRSNLDGGVDTLVELLTGVGAMVTSFLPTGEGETAGF